MKIQYWESSGKGYLQLIDNTSTLVSKVIIDFNCNEYQRYKEYNLILLCSPQKRWEDTDTLKTVADLEMFYSKFGFVRTDELLPTMIRKSNI